MKSQTLWLSYDLGLKGDYENLYQFLDNYDAKECGDSIAFIKKFEYEDNFIKEFEKAISDTVDITNGNKIYLVYKDDGTGSVKGKFLFGKRKKAPWEGYAIDPGDSGEDIAK